MNTVDGDGMTDLHWAARRGDTEACIKLLNDEHFTGVDAVANNGGTALHYAAAYGYTEACVALVTHKRFTAVDAVDEDGKTALHYAAAQGHTEACTAIESKAAQASTDPAENPSMWAISFQQLLDVYQHAKTKFGSDFESRTMRDINNMIIIPVCEKDKTSYALAKNPKGLKTDTFVSHSWDEPFGEFMQSITEAFKTKYDKPHLWICAFALVQGSSDNIQTQLEMALDQSPFVRALKSADNFLVVRNSRTDLYSRIWCICEIMFARKFDFIPKKTQITGPDCFTDVHVSCLDARSFSPTDKEKILRVLLENKEARAEIDEYIKEFRDFNSDGVVADKKSANERNETVEGFLGTKWFSAMKGELDDIGVEAVDDFKDLEKDEIDILAGKLKNLQARKFRKRLSEITQKE